MKSLLLKEYYTLKKQIPLFLFVAAMLAMIKGSLSIYGIIYAALLPITAVAYDERSKWDVLSAAMPYTVTELVLSKYIVGWISISAAAALFAAVRKLLFELSNGKIGESGDLLLFKSLMGITISLLITAIIIPIIMKFGVEKGRLIYSLAIGICFGVPAFLGRVLTDVYAADFDYGYVIYGVGVIALNILSAGISILFYKKRNRA